MARTELYLIKNDEKKKVDYYGAAEAASMGAMHIWAELEKKYLPSLERYSYESDLMVMKNPNEYRSRITQGMIDFFHGGESIMKEVLDLVFKPELEWNDRIIMESTMDGVYIARKYLREVAEAYRSVEYTNKNMQQQADIMDEIYDKYTDDDVIGVYILGTSVCSISDMAKYDDGDEEYEFPMMNDDWRDFMTEMYKFRELGFDMDKYEEWWKEHYNLA